MRIARSELYAGRLLLIALMALTVLPFISIFTTALYPSGAVPVGLSWPSEPRWSNFIDAFQVANMGALLFSSVLIVVAETGWTASAKPAPSAPVITIRREGSGDVGGVMATEA